MNKTKAEKIVEELKKKVGQVLKAEDDGINPDKMMLRSMPTFSGWNSEVELNTIKKFALINEDLNALWFDEEYAKQSRWGGITAPPTFFFGVCPGSDWAERIVYSEGLYDQPIDERSKGSFDQAFYAGCQLEFFEPIKPGDTITYECKLADVFEKEGRRGKLTFIIHETTYINQKGEVVVKNRSTSIFVRDSKIS
ncbi:MaoC family dehydratase N-terminal domain-containing protein [Thermodesulfobacteriota bacterium]